MCACSSDKKSGGKSADEDCKTPEDCAGQPCTDGKCEGSMDGGVTQNPDGSTSPGTPGKTPAGSACTSASDCESGTCSGKLCQPAGMLPNTSCTSGPDCASGICESNVCKIPAGASGTIDQSECAPGSLGCSCQPMDKCKHGLTCVGGMCCNSKTMSCDPGAGQMSGGGGTPTTACTPGVVGPVVTECGYPFASKNPLTSILFNESTVLAAIVPSGGYPFASIQLFYNDEHAMTLGVRETVINGVSTKFPVSPLTKSPDVINAPQTGTNMILGPLAGVDPVGRPMWPALFITDITNDATAVSGDWQWGGTPVNPTYVAGTWKGAVRTVDSTGAVITPDADPVKNNQDYGNGHAAPAGSIVKAEGYGTEVRWDIRLEAGHNYRFQVMVHDGDQNRVGGDSGEACVTFCAGNQCPAGVTACTADTECQGGQSCTGGCCITPPANPTPENPDGNCADDWKQYIKPDGDTICTPPPTDGTCPEGYVITIQNGQQYCTPVLVVL